MTSEPVSLRTFSVETSGNPPDAPAYELTPGEQQWDWESRVLAVH